MATACFELLVIKPSEYIEDKHREVCQLALYKKQLIQINFSEEHQVLWSLGQGTKVELQATSDFFGIPVYTGMLNSRGILLVFV